VRLRLRRRTRLNIIAFLASTIIAILGFEVALALFDPWGMHYFDDLAGVWDHVIADPHRVDVLPPGVYRFSNWTVTQIEGFTRQVPNNKGGSCKVVFVGDSVTWGHGVNDGDTWVNLVADQLSGTTVINAGFEGYNSENVKGTLVDFPEARVIFYFIVGNDAEPTTGVLRQTRASMLRKYLSYIFRPSITSSGPAASPDTTRFRSDIQQMSQDSRLLFLGFEEPLAQSLKPTYNILLIPLYHFNISKVDAHPNPAGHREIADAVLPYIRAAVAQKCP